MKNSKSPPIRVLVHDHIQVSRLIGYFIITQREELYKCIFLIGEEVYKCCCLLGVEKSCTDLANIVLSSGVQGVDFGVYQNQDKKNLKWVLGDWM